MGEPRAVHLPHSDSEDGDMPQEKTASATRTATKSTTARKPKPPNYDPFVRHSVTVAADRKTAFKVFLEDFPQWWPENFRTTKVGAPLGVDPKKGGRLYEIDEQGEEHTFGLIRTVDAPDTLAVGWRLNGFGRIDPDNASEFTVTFVPDGQKKTRVEVEHTHFDRMGTKHAKRVRNGMDKGWPTILASFEKRIKEVTAK
ncbi:hypothetical protein Vse01_39870 [Micromonospora sediminimaris]|uniref:Activator of Hsp90 ATPase homologue 1/2-like C-terminal domain-containing protein n=2 Tax=Micromonosporaceae TaxID=28056 RepID=A0A9W5UUF5_9ACTN|nr:hypothetical protein Vse01_39870 [Micromonospora sediminimaris]